jgi:hypothetical protein
MQTIKNNKVKTQKKNQFFKKNQANLDEPSKPGLVSKT